MMSHEYSHHVSRASTPNCTPIRPRPTHVSADVRLVVSTSNDWNFCWNKHFTCYLVYSLCRNRRSPLLILRRPLYTVLNRLPTSPRDLHKIVDPTNWEPVGNPMLLALTFLGKLLIFNKLKKYQYIPIYYATMFIELCPYLEGLIVSSKLKKNYLFKWC